MFEYKSESFYTSYFSKLDGFRIIDEFKKSKEEDEKNLYVGMIEVLNTIHQLVLRVEIPVSFPHMKLVFRTKSLSGYPHLIHSGKTQYGDWFCLNTPFAETAEGQLEQEINRLKEWINRQMREDLPPVISDPQVITALRIANAYEWENSDEMDEYKADADITFLGDYYKKPESFKENIGTIKCIKTPDNRFYAVDNEAFCNFSIPYIIVEEFPKSLENLKDLMLLAKQYDWDDAMFKHLLPKIGISTYSHHVTYKKINDGKVLSEDEALSILKDKKNELQKDDSYLKAETKTSSGSRRSRPITSDKDEFKIPKKVHPVIKPLILDEIEKLEQQVTKNHSWDGNPWSHFAHDVGDPSKMTEDEREEYEYQQAQIDHWIEYGQYEFNYFALGYKTKDSIDWVLLCTNHAEGEYDETEYDIGIADAVIKKLVSYRLWISIPQEISVNQYFGRGKFCDVLISKKIAIVGLGAIGSVLAESLVRGGTKSIALWDSDTIEPGNICRSVYDVRDLGESKVEALSKKLYAINPLSNILQIKKEGCWHYLNANYRRYVNGSFYGDVEYSNQEDAINKIKDFDLIIDCTGSNEMLHFLSYAIPETPIVSLCITNHSTDLVCVTSHDGNPFELRKAYLSRIEQDTKNFFLEGSGCYSPTFLATNCDISSLVNLAVRDLNANMAEGNLLHSTIWSHDRRGVLADHLVTYKLENYDIRMTISSETVYDGEELPDVLDGPIGYLLGSYSRDGLLIMVTHIVSADGAEQRLIDAFKTSKGIIDYIGDFAYSDGNTDSYSDSTLALLSQKAQDNSINTCNPLLALKNIDGGISFFLYINNKLEQFILES